MTLHYPDTDAAPTSFGAQPRDPVNPSYATETAAEPTFGAPVEEDIIPIYARKQPKKTVAGVPKAALMAIPVVLALGVGAWALTAGESSRKTDAAAPAESTDSLTTSRLDVAQPVSPEVAAPAAPEAAKPVETPPPALRSAPVPRATRSSASAPVARRVAAPARHSAPRAAAPAASQSSDSGALTTVITEPTPAPVIAPPTPMEPIVITPPATPPGGQS